MSGSFLYQNLTCYQVNGVTDIVLVVIMGYYLSDMTLPRHEKRLVIFLGSGSILTVLSLIVVLTVVYGPFEQTVDRQIVTLGVTHLGVSTAPQIFLMH